MKWETRTICTFIAASVPMEKATDVNPLLEAANKIGLDNDLSDEEKEAAASAKPNEPQPGSYERFMTTFGSPQRWAGR